MGDGPASTSAVEGAPSSRRARVAVGLTLLILLVLSVVLLPVGDITRSFFAWVEGLGYWGPVVVALAYIPAGLVAFPGSVLTLGAGFLFGVVKGTLAVSAGSTAGAAAAFLVARRVGRTMVESRLNNHPRFRAVERAVGGSGFRIVFLTRLSPLFPYNFLNFAYGVTSVSFRDYLLGSWIGMLPGTVMYVYLGAAAKDLTQLFSGDLQGGVAQQVLTWGGLLATIVVTVIVTRIARRTLREISDEEEEQA